MGAAAELQSLMPVDKTTLGRFGKGDDRKLKSYLLMLAAFLEGRGIHTKRAYKAAIGQFFTLFHWMCPEDVTPAHCVAFKKHLLDTGRAHSTVYFRIAAMTSLFEYFCQAHGTSGESLLQSNPWKRVPRSDIKITPYAHAIVMEWKTLNTILESIPNDPDGLRDKAILLFFAYTGRRRAEVANLKVKDLRLDATPPTYSVRVKGGREKTFELPDVCSKTIKAYWLAADRLKSLTPDSGVFAPGNGCSLNSDCNTEKTLSPRALNDMFRRRAVRAGVPLEKAHPHAIRHMTAHELDQAGVRLQDIQAFIDHANPNTTQIYTRTIGRSVPSQEAVLDSVRRAAAALGKNIGTEGQ